MKMVDEHATVLQNEPRIACCFELIMRISAKTYLGVLNNWRDERKRENCRHIYLKTACKRNIFRNL